MTQRFTRRFRVRHYELGALGEVDHVTLVRYVQEAAIEASTALGIGPDWYRAHGTLWVMWRLSARYFAPVSAGDEVEIVTWISGLRGVRSTREYELARRRDDAPVARARAEWVYVEGQTGQPTRCPEEWAEMCPRGGKPEALGTGLADARPTEGAHRYVSRRRAQYHELDAARHVNHAVYLHWAGQAYLDAVRAAGCPPERTTQDGWTVREAGHEVRYFAPALDNDSIEVVSWISETAEAGWAWTHEAFNADSRKLLARVCSAASFVNLEGGPAALPRQAVADVLRGPPADQGSRGSA